jgi:glucose/arabinose dehydrogenase
MDFNPKDKTLWFTDNQVDGMGDDVPPGEINRATKAGENFGFPYYGGGHTRTDEYKNENTARQRLVPAGRDGSACRRPGYGLLHRAHVPGKIPERDLLRTARLLESDDAVGARVMVTYLKEDGTADKAEPFAEGWLDENGEYLGRPVDVAQLRDGSLLVSDDLSGALYRIWYDGR